MKTVKSTSFAMLLKRKKKSKKGKFCQKNTKLDLSACQNAVAMAMPNGVEKQLIHHNVSKESCTEVNPLLKIAGVMEPIFLYFRELRIIFIPLRKYHLDHMPNDQY